MKPVPKIQIEVTSNGASLTGRAVGPKPVMPPEPIDEYAQRAFSEAARVVATLRAAARTPAEREQVTQNLQAGRRRRRAAKLAAGETLEFLSAEARRELCRKAGKASAGKRTSEQRKAAGERLRRGKELHRVARDLELETFEVSVQRLSVAERAKIDQAAAIAREPVIRLPRSSPRREPNVFLKLLCRVDEGLEHSAFGYHGSFFRPGIIVPESALTPTADYPPTAIILECAGRVGDEGEVSFVLWRQQQREWIKIAEARSKDWSWSIDLRPLAIRALRDQGFPRQRRIDPDELSRVSTRLGGLIDAELAGLDPDLAENVLGIVHDAMASRLAASGNGGRRSLAAAVIDVKASDAE